MRRMWINRHTGAIDFTATIRAHNLTYLGWEVEPRAGSAHVPLDEFYTGFNRIPLALRHLIRTDL